ncbi:MULTISPECIES: copper-binding protein [unclassified Leisingera]|uniref:copper-binding protein n=1 Tax=unclassified Leisingera TaxID=2614906 RepID=UPI001012CD33|nr:MULTISPECIES: copper-binding protein [unclassified Leisingera]MBQ4825668.1 copper-binding protein [Leisingera sp. HS039]MCF6433418.1 copper-binding protein [Leisingera sp. MMG026]QAX32398.1 cupredoxin [Leisingera sp. NJS204]QBR39015.1 cupredoxin [Leisingera sp. NJS201]
MNKILSAAILGALAAAPAFAAGTHGGGHHDEMEVGKPGEAAHADREIAVTMKETDDGEMIFEPSGFSFTKGETIKFVITNAGELEHEFVLDTAERNVHHKELMAKMDMEHDDPNSVRLDAGATGEIIWTFSNLGTFEFACLIPGHYESGMHGPVAVLEGGGGTFTAGTVKKIDAKSGKVTIKHEELVDLEMPAMTMVFRVAHAAMLEQMQAGGSIEFVAERVKGKLTVTAVR